MLDCKSCQFMTSISHGVHTRIKDNREHKLITESTVLQLQCQTFFNCTATLAMSVVNSFVLNKQHWSHIEL